MEAVSETGSRRSRGNFGVRILPYYLLYVFFQKKRKGKKKDKYFTTCKNKNIRPTMIDCRLSTGRQSSRRMFKQMWPEDARRCRKRKSVG